MHCVNAPCLGNVWVTVKVARYKLGMPHTFNARDTLPATGVGKYACHPHSMPVGPTLEASIKHLPGGLR
jgi:hypothetical protein